MMEVMIFAAGKGTRLKPLTDVIPKALVPVDDIPLIQRVYRKMVDAGAEKVVVNVHHHAEQLKNYCRLLESAYGVKIEISDESDKLLETGGGIKKARKWFTQPVLIHNCDILSNTDLKAFYAEGKKADATLLVSDRQTSRYLLFDDSMRLKGWTNIQTGEVKSPYSEVVENGGAGLRRYAFSGIHVINTTLFPLMDSWGDAFPIIDFYLRHCAECNIRGYLQQDLKILDVGKLDTLEQAGDFLNSSQFIVHSS